MKGFLRSLAKTEAHKAGASHMFFSSISFACPDGQEHCLDLKCALFVETM